MLCKTFVIGYLGGEPEGRYTPSGTAVTDFNVAASRAWTSNGEKVKETTWFKTTVWGSLAEVCSQYLHKGSPVFIEGSLKPDARGNCRVWTNKDGDLWLDKDNQPRAGFELMAKEVLFLNRVEGPNGEAGYEQVDLNTAADFA